MLDLLYDWNIMYVIGMHRKSMEVAQHLTDGMDGHPMDEAEEMQMRKAMMEQAEAEEGQHGGHMHQEQEDFRSSSIAALRAKAHEHSVKMMAESGNNPHHQHHQNNSNHQQQHAAVLAAAAAAAIAVSSANNSSSVQNADVFVDWKK